MRILVSALFAVFLALPLHARALGDDEQAGLMKSVDRYLRATGAGNAEKIVETIPPRIVNVFAGTSGVEAKEVQKTLISQTEALLKTTSFQDFQASKGPFDATDATLADGTVVTWVVVATEFTSQTNGQKTRNSQPLLALLEDGKWYFTRIDGPQQQQLVALAYPFVAELKMPASSSVPLQ